MTNTLQESDSNSLQEAASTLGFQIKLLGGLLLLLWGLEIVDFILGNALDSYGIQPRSLIGLRGILFAPFLHFGFGHVMANSLPFVVLGWFVLLRGFSSFVTTTFYTILVGGIGVWLVGASNSNHLGASILVFGFLGYLFSIGWYERSIQAISITLLAVMLYGSLIWGVLPIMEGVSWEGHLFGFIGGVLAARTLGPKQRLLNQIKVDEYDDF